MAKANKAQEMEELLQRLSQECRLDSWTSFIEPVDVPRELYVALQTGRPELLSLLQPRAMTEQEVANLYTLISVLIRTNMALREHAAEVAHMVKIWGDAFKHLHSVGRRIEDFAQFRSATSEEDGTD